MRSFVTVLLSRRKSQKGGLVLEREMKKVMFLVILVSTLVLNTSSWAFQRVVLGELFTHLG